MQPISNTSNNPTHTDAGVPGTAAQNGEGTPTFHISLSLPPQGPTIRVGGHLYRLSGQTLTARVFTRDETEVRKHPKPVLDTSLIVKGDQVCCDKGIWFTVNDIVYNHNDKCTYWRGRDAAGAFRQTKQPSAFRRASGATLPTVESKQTDIDVPWTEVKTRFIVDPKDNVEDLSNAGPDEPVGNVTFIPVIPSAHVSEIADVVNLLDRLPSNTDVEKACLEYLRRSRAKADYNARCLNEQ